LESVLTKKSHRLSVSLRIMILALDTWFCQFRRDSSSSWNLHLPLHLSRLVFVSLFLLSHPRFQQNLVSSFVPTFQLHFYNDKHVFFLRRKDSLPTFRSVAFGSNLRTIRSPRLHEDDTVDESGSESVFSTPTLEKESSSLATLPFITPYQIIHHDSFPLEFERNSKMNSGKAEIDHRTTGYDRVLSLHSVMNLMRSCLRRISDIDDIDSNKLESVLDHASLGPLNHTFASSESFPSLRIVRIEHQVYTSSIDPLSWLRQQLNFVDITDSVFYLCTHENDFEVAVIGSAMALNNTQRLWDLYFPKECLVERLCDPSFIPTNTRWYGGARFDPYLNHTEIICNEWKSFGTAHWILPAIELLVKSSPEISFSPKEKREFVSTFAIHLVVDETLNQSWRTAAKALLRILDQVDAQCAAKVPPTTLPPIISRGNALHDDISTSSNNNPYLNQEYQKDSQDLYEESVAQALLELEPLGQSIVKSSEQIPNDSVSSLKPSVENSSNSPLDKVVLARKQTVHFGASFTALDVLCRWKYGGHEGGHLFYMRPNSAAIEGSSEKVSEFFGCTPERLFAVNGDSGTVISEALAGTRPRGSTQNEDEILLRDLFSSPKDRRENRLTGQFIEQVFDFIHGAGLVTKLDDTDSEALSSTKDTFPTQYSGFGREGLSSGFFVRRLLHLQHICQRYSSRLVDKEKSLEVARLMLHKLHPTPAVCGLPAVQALNFIRRYESICFDRGLYSGPFGYIGYRGTDILVALRCGLATSTPFETSVSTYAGAGIVSGSTVQGEWAETNYKLAVISSLFPQSPMSLRGAQNANTAWSTAFVAELIRNGITRFYVCPGSRSTPLVAAIAKAVRSNLGVVHAISVHDERSAGFRAVGYGRGSSKIAAVVTSSGTAVANLYPAVVEAGMDGVPVLLLTADRPYESRASGSNQAIDQVKVFSDTYIRWFRDVLPPDDDVPVSLALSDACQAIYLAKELRGPVHINIQFRENLAPDAGPIRGDSRIDSLTLFNGMRFTDVPGFDRWCTSGNVWSKLYKRSIKYGPPDALHDVASLIRRSKRGIILVGNLRSSTEGLVDSDQAAIVQSISDFAKAIGFPIFAGVQSANLRFISSAVVLFSESLLNCRLIAENLQPDLVVQIGAPLVSTSVSNILSKTSKARNSLLPYVLLHPHSPQERYDPSMIVTHTISSEVSPFLHGLFDVLNSKGLISECSSELAPIVLLGRLLQESMKKIIFDASHLAVKGENSCQLTEPQLVVALSEAFSNCTDPRSLFLSNSMPIRDSDMFLYPLGNSFDRIRSVGPSSVGTNRGASGIDGIISSALGYSESTLAPTTLVIGDVAALHDIGSLHSVANNAIQQNHPSFKKRNPLISIIVNNDGGGIFSFLPIANHGDVVGFDEFFGTPTSSFSFQRGADAFGLRFDAARDYESFRKKYAHALEVNHDTILEARVLKRAANVAVHRKIAKDVEGYVNDLLLRKPSRDIVERLPVRTYRHRTSAETNRGDQRTLVLIHGWMGDKLEWHTTAEMLSDRLGSSWKIHSADLPGHGGSPLHVSSDIQMIRSSLRLFDEEEVEFMTNGLSIDCMAEAVLKTLLTHQHLERIDALAGYSAGGRVALAMKRLCALDAESRLLTPETSLILLGAFPGDINQNNPPQIVPSTEDAQRTERDDRFAHEIENLCDKACLHFSVTETKLIMDGFLKRWYDNAIWSSLKTRGNMYYRMIEKRSLQLSFRGKDIALALSHSSPPKGNKDDWRFCLSENTLFIAGELDVKYTSIGKLMQKMNLAIYEEIPDASHALLTEAPSRVADVIASYLIQNSSMPQISVSAKVVTNMKRSTQPTSPSVQAVSQPVWAQSLDGRIVIDSLEYETYSVNMLTVNENRKLGIFGVGWDKNAAVDDTVGLKKREGIIIQLTGSNGLLTGIGEICPLTGLHSESLVDARRQVQTIQDFLRNAQSYDLPSFDAENILTLNGSLNCFISELARATSIDSIFSSVRSGFEMALVSLAAQQVRLPIHQALNRFAIKENKNRLPGFLPLSGFVSRRGRDDTFNSKAIPNHKHFQSIKVKVGYQDSEADKASMLQGFQWIGRNIYRRSMRRIRADANRAWNESQVVEFAASLEGLDVHALEKIEYIEEPLQKVTRSSTHSSVEMWSLEAQVSALERTFFKTSISYALDESLVDLVVQSGRQFDGIQKELEDVFKNGSRGCATVVLKPTLIGFELSFRIARLARTKLGIGAVFSSSFDTGVGLAHIAFFSSIVDNIESLSVETYPHGIGTFMFLESDTITPPFASYVNENGMLNVPSLSRALFGVSLEEIRDSSTKRDESYVFEEYGEAGSIYAENLETAYEASTATSSSGTEISVVVSLPLPFSADIAWSRFTDLPSMSRWSPWITSVRYHGMEETEWMINIRGIPLKWRAKSRLINEPFKGIQWESVNGLKNRGIVEFIEEKVNQKKNLGVDFEDQQSRQTSSCLMNVRMTLTPPRLFRPLIQGASTLFLEEFLRDKLLKWSLEMFRDVVKADLALERCVYRFSVLLFKI
jgi:2-succinyl-5-enolpyruvyl-6-hydroxy-3-cyclohexene-1-carboxylate synthase